VPSFREFAPATLTRLILRVPLPFREGLIAARAARILRRCGMIRA
jgi:hypothetical protein